jgi:hypothetical protein
MLITIRLAHTAVWVGFVGCIVAIWVFAVQSRLPAAALAIGVVLIEVAVLAMNRGRCPLAALAGRYTAERRDGFDIYLPAWLARRTKSIFGTLYLLGILVTLAQWGQTAR